MYVNPEVIAITSTPETNGIITAANAETLLGAVEDKCPMNAKRATEAPPFMRKEARIAFWPDVMTDLNISSCEA